MASAEDLMEMLKVFAKREWIYAQMFEDVEIKALWTQRQEAGMDAEVRVKEKWSNFFGMMSFGDLHSLFDITSIPFLIYINKPITTSVNLNVNCIRLPKIGELIKFSIFCKNVNDDIFVVSTFVYDQKGELIASGNHNLKTLKKALVMSEKI